MNKILARGLVGQRAVNTADERECGIAFVYVFVMATAEDKPLRCQLAIRPSAMVSILRFLYLRTNGGTNGQISRCSFQGSICLRSRRNFGRRVSSIMLVKITAAITDFDCSRRLG